MNVKWRLLLIEDDQALALGLRVNLEAEGYAVIHAASAEEGLDVLDGTSVDLIVLDLMLPGMDGLEALKRIRKDDPRIPVLILTAKSLIENKVDGLKAGADDYLTKPFHLEEFLLRVGRILDRYEWYKPEDVLSVGRVTINFNTLEIIRAGDSVVRITPHEANLIQYLAQHQERIVSRAELLKHVWGLDPEIETRTVDTFVSRIRRYLEEDPSNPVHIISIRGRGYRFMP
jgi:DNA-binding response OmpR family regulator